MTSGMGGASAASEEHDAVSLLAMAAQSESILAVVGGIGCTGNEYLAPTDVHAHAIRLQYEVS